MPRVLDTVLLLALPASGKSEVRKYLDLLDPAVAAEDFHMGRSVQLDDYPYVHFMRRIDDELVAMNRPGLFFQAPDRSFADPWDWGTLVELVNMDYADMVGRNPVDPPSAAYHLFDRIDTAAARAGARVKLGSLDPDTRAAIATALESEVRQHFHTYMKAYPTSMVGRTLVIEFARGGAEGSPLPLPPPFGYRHSLARLSPKILEKAAILYVWVTPEESRRKNRERARPDGQGSILFHGVPEVVMRGDYGLDDIEWLLQNSGKPDSIRIDAHGRTFYLPLARFDNRVDLTTFVRGPRETWPADKITALHNGLKAALDTLVRG